MFKNLRVPSQIKEVKASWENLQASVEARKMQVTKEEKAATKEKIGNRILNIENDEANTSPTTVSSIVKILTT